MYVGGTGDITVHRVEDNGSLHEIHMATGGEMGGRRVDHAFMKIWEFVFGIYKCFKILKLSEIDFIFNYLNWYKRPTS